MNKLPMLAFLVPLLLFSTLWQGAVCTQTSSVVADSNNTHNPAATITGLLQCKNLENIRCADQFTGKDWGSKVNAASADLGHAGQIWVTQLAGTSNATAINLSIEGQVLKFVEGGTFSSSAQIILSGNQTSIEGFGCKQGDFNTPATCPVQIQEAAAANLTQLVSVTGAGSSLASIQLDGNMSKQTSGGLGVNCQALRCSMDLVVTSNFKINGMQATSTGTTNQAAGMKVYRSASYNNGNDGLLCIGSQDMWLRDNEFENNRGNGVELSASNGCAGSRLFINDYGGNVGSGLRIGSGLYSGGQSNTEIFVIGAQFGNNQNHDLYITGWDSTNNRIAARGITIEGLQFIGLCGANGMNCTSGPATSSNTYDAIHIEDGIANVIEGNLFNSAAPTGPSYRYAIREIQNSGHTLGVDEISGNFFTQAISGVPFGTGFFRSDNPRTGFHGNNENGAASSLFTNPYFLNNAPLRWKDVSGTQQDIINLGDDNNTYIYGHPTRKQIILQPVDGVTQIIFGNSTIAVQTGQRFKIADQGTCTMSRGTCMPQSLGSSYAAPPQCFASWTGTGSLTGIIKVPSTTTMVRPASTVNTDTAQINWGCYGN